MTISELIAHVGDANINVQFLHDSVVSMNNGKKRPDGTITFATEKAKVAQLMEWHTGGAKPAHIGVVVWLPRDKLPESMR